MSTIGKDSTLKHVSSSPHLRDSITTGGVMFNVIIGLIPLTIVGIGHFGLSSALVIITSILSCMVTEYVFDLICHRPNTLYDGSAILTGLLMALCLPPSVPLYCPVAGGIFAILFGKCFFGGLGQNFMNPALAGRAFLLISFGKVMTDYSYDAVTGATPLAVLGNGGSVNVLRMFLGLEMGHIGASVICIIIGGIWLIVSDTISWEIPVASIVSFIIFMAAFGEKGMDPMFIAAHLVGGGFMLGAFFMATDPVTSPMTWSGQLIFGCLYGFLSAIFRCFGSMADSSTYAIIIANLAVPLIDLMPVPQPFGIGKKGASVIPSVEEMNAPKKSGIAIPPSAIVLTLITVVAGGTLAGVNMMTADQIAENKLAKALEAYEAVVPDADSFAYDDAVTAQIEEMKAAGYYADGAFGKAYINEAVQAVDASGNIVGYAINCSSMEGYDGEIALSVGFDTEGTVIGISFTTLTETAGMGMLVDTDDWKAQFANVKVDSFTLNKAGGSTADNEIDSVSGASTTSGAVVNAVNAAIDFYNNYLIAG